MSDNGGGAFFAGLVIGALAGAAAALLLAPQSGEEIRKNLGERSVEFKGQAQKLAHDTVAQMQQQVNQVSEQGRIVLTDSIKKTQHAVQTAQTRLGKIEEVAIE